MWDRKGEDLHIWEYIFEKHFAFWTQWWVVRKQWDLFKWDRVWNHKNITISYCHKIYNVAKLMYEFISFKKCCKINLIVVNLKEFCYFYTVVLWIEHPTYLTPQRWRWFMIQTYAPHIPLLPTCIPNHSDGDITK